MDNIRDYQADCSSAGRLDKNLTKVSSGGDQVRSGVLGVREHWWEPRNWPLHGQQNYWTSPWYVQNLRGTIQSKTPHRPPSGLTFLPSCTHERPTTAGVAVEAVAGTTAAVAVVGAGAGQEAAGGMANQGMPWLKPGTNRRRSVYSESRSLDCV